MPDTIDADRLGQDALSLLAVCSAQLFAQDDGFGDLTHIFPALTALLLHHAIGLIFIDAQLLL